MSSKKEFGLQWHKPQNALIVGMDYNNSPWFFMFSLHLLFVSVVVTFYKPERDIGYNGKPLWFPHEVREQREVWGKERQEGVLKTFEKNVEYLQCVECVGNGENFSKMSICLTKRLYYGDRITFLSGLSATVTAFDHESDKGFHYTIRLSSINPTEHLLGSDIENGARIEYVHYGSKTYSDETQNSSML